MGNGAGSGAGEPGSRDDLWAVIMAGGRGTRFWPLSRRDRPKQFLTVTGGRSLLQATWDRVLETVEGPARILVVTVADYRRETAEQLPDLPADNLLLEPRARNTAPCIAWAAARLTRRDPDAVMAVYPADHAIDGGGFGEAVETAAAAARSLGMLVTFGIRPRYPETGYGYIETGDRLDVPTASDGPGVRKVAAFREKPDRETARRYLEAGNFFWNSGIFVWSLETIREELVRHLPDAWEGAEAMVAAAGDAAAEAAAYDRMPPISIDYGVMEKSERVACVEAPFRWSDLGSWAALGELLEADDEGNVVEGRLLGLDARDNVVHAPGELVALLGIEGVAVIRSGDTTLVVDLKRSQEVKELRRRLRELGLEDHL